MNKERQNPDRFAEPCNNHDIANSSQIEQMVNLAGIGRGDRVLGIGCDAGVLALRIRDAVGDAGRLMVVDDSLGMDGEATEKYRHIQGVIFLAADIMELHNGEAFSHIICLNSFPRMSDTQSFLIKLRGMLAEDGVLVIARDGSTAGRDDHFLPMGTTAELLENLSYLVIDVVDNGELSFVKACRR